ncbi:MAG: CAP domain-containing protein [Candidatus Micrarchaeia archaeon]
MAEEFTKEILEKKKKYFIRIVKETSKKLGIPTPYINFNGCPAEGENQLAHFHPDNYTICVSERQLMKQTFDDIFNTASHEVNHVFNYSHDDRFYQEHNKLKTKIWNPRREIEIYNSFYKNSKKRKRKTKLKNECRYHNCKETESLTKCKYCREQFCKEHIEPRLVELPNFRSGLISDDWRDEGGHPCFPYTNYRYQLKKEEDRKYNEALDKFLNKSKSIQSIPVYPYRASNAEENSFIKLKSEIVSLFSKRNIILIIMLVLILTILILQFNQNFNSIFYPFIGKNCSATLKSGECWKNNQPWYCDDGKLIERSDICGCPSLLRPYNFSCIIKYECEDGTLDPDCSKNKPYQCVKGQLIKNPLLCGCPENHLFDNITNTCKKIEICSDGTLYDQCSPNKPLFCDNGDLIPKASLCNCSNPYYFAIDDYCIDIRNPNEIYIRYLEQKIHESINRQRNFYGLANLTLDPKLSEIARLHSKDMATYNYFDHINLKGLDPTQRGNQLGYTCYKNYGNYYTIGLGENIFMIHTYKTIWYTNGIETSRDWYAPDEIVFEVVNGWMKSTGHRQNILESRYDKEGIGVWISEDGRVYVTEDFC